VTSLQSGHCGGFLFSRTSRPAVGTAEPPVRWVPGVLFPRGGGGGSAPPFSAEVWNEWKNTSSPPPLSIMAWTGKTLPFFYLPGQRAG
jgi:hypothetical protein